MNDGVTHERAETSADESYDRMMAPPCPACGRAIDDDTWRRHCYEEHAQNEVVHPYGKPDAREAVFLGLSKDDLDRKVTTWRARHPGVSLKLMADGRRAQGRLYWQRYRVG